MTKSFTTFIKLIREMGCNYPVSCLWAEYKILTQRGNTADICDEALVAFSRMQN